MESEGLIPQLRRPAGLLANVGVSVRGLHLLLLIDSFQSAGAPFF